MTVRYAHTDPAAPRDPVRTTTLRGVPALFGVACAACASVSLAIGACDAWSIHRESTWILAEASVQSSEVVPTGDDSPSAMVVRCAVAYAAAGRRRVAILRSRSSLQSGPIAKMEEWVAAHPSGSVLPVRYDPSRPDRAAYRFPDEMMNHASVKNDLFLAAVFAALGGCLLLAARTLGWRRSAR